MAYSLDLREKAVAYVKSGGTRILAAKTFGIGEKTIRRWLKLQKNTGSLKPSLHNAGRKAKINVAELEEFVSLHPDKTLHEIAEIFGVHPTSIWKRLKKMNYVFKKKSALCREK